MVPNQFVAVLVHEILCFRNNFTVRDYDFVQFCYHLCISSLYITYYKRYGQSSNYSAIVCLEWRKDMSYKRLYYFFILGQERNYSEAAKRIGIKQPTLSQQINLLEEELH